MIDTKKKIAKEINDFNKKFNTGYPEVTWQHISDARAKKYLKRNKK